MRGLAVLFVLLAASPASASLGPAELVHPGSLPAAAHDAAGTVHATYAGPSGLTVAARPATGPWSSPLVLDASASTAALSAGEGAIAGWLGCDGAGCGPRVQLTGPGGTWAAGHTALTAGAGRAAAPSVAIGDDGSATAAWVEQRPDGDVVRVARRPQDGVWSAPRDLATGTTVQVAAVPGSGDAWVVHASRPQGAPARIEARRLQGDVWGPPETVTTSEEDPGLEPASARVTAGPDGVPTVAWSSQSPSGQTPEVRAARRNAGSGRWAAQQLTETDQGGTPVALLAEAGDGVTLAFADQGLPPTQGTVGVVRHSGGQWGAPARFPSASGWRSTGDGLMVPGLTARLAVARDGTAALAYNSGGSLLLRTRQAGAWSAAETVSTANGARGVDAEGGATHGYAPAVDPAGSAEILFAAGQGQWLCSRRQGTGAGGPGVCTGQETPGDRDGDGIPDDTDACPDTVHPGNPADCTPVAEPPLPPFGGDGCAHCAAPGPMVDRRALLAALVPGRLRIRALLRRRGHRTTFAAPTAGALDLKWVVRSRRRGHVVVASGRRGFAAAGPVRVRLRLAKAGRKRLRRARRVRIVGIAAFRPLGATPVSTTARFTLRR